VEGGLGSLAAVEVVGPCRGRGVAAVRRSWSRWRLEGGRKEGGCRGRDHEAPPKPYRAAAGRWPAAGERAGCNSRVEEDELGTLDHGPAAQIHRLNFFFGILGAYNIAIPKIYSCYTTNN
jgi:hypothetical protein